MTIGKPRKKAHERGEKYYAGKPCKYCGSTKRYTSTAALACTAQHRWAAMDDTARRAHYDATREAHRKYARKYREENREQYNKQHAELRRRRGAKQREYMKLYMREYRKRQKANEQTK